MESETLSLEMLGAYDPQPLLSGEVVRYLCPCCGDSKPRDNVHRTLIYWPDKGNYHCNRCGIKDRVTEVWKGKPQEGHRRRTTGPAQVYEAIRRAATPEPEKELKPESQEKFERIKGYLKPIEGTPAADYLSGRGIPIATATAAGVMFLPAYGTRPHCAAFLIQDGDGQAVAVSLRGINADHKQSLGTKSAGAFMTSPDCLGYDYVAITEAPIDSLSLEVCGVSSVALSGTGDLPPWLKRKLQRGSAGTSRLVLAAYDSDAAGDQAAAKLVERLPLANVQRVRPDHGKDWNEMLGKAGKAAIVELFRAVY